MGWPQQAERMLGMEGVNLGFSGNGKATATLFWTILHVFPQLYRTSSSTHTVCSIQLLLGGQFGQFADWRLQSDIVSKLGLQA